MPTSDLAGAEIIRVASRFRGLYETAHDSAWDNPVTAGSDPEAQEAVPGLIFFMQMGSSVNGHCGIVVKADEGSISTIEGNTCPDPADAPMDHEGDGIFRRTRSMSFAPRIGSLRLRGFLPPPAF